MSYLAARRPGAAPMQRVVDIGTAGSWEQAHRTVQAEVDTAAALRRLGPGWRTLHSLPVGPGPATLAHLVIGPQGMFAISSLPHRATVLDVVDGHVSLSVQGSEDALAEVRQLAQRVLAGLRQRLGRAVDIPAVHPLLCLTDGTELPARQSGDDHAQRVELQRLVARLQAHPRRLTAAWVQRLATVAEEPVTWDAPACEWFPPDLPARYDTIVRSGAHESRPAASPVPTDRVVPGLVTASQPPQPPSATRGLRAVSVLLVLLGMASLGTIGMLSLPTLALGGLTLRHHGGWTWINDKDASLLLVGMGMAVLPVLGWMLALPVLLASVA